MKPLVENPTIVPGADIIVGIPSYNEGEKYYLIERWDRAKSVDGRLFD